MFCDIASQLCHLDLLHEISLEAPKKNFTLSWFESINDRSDAPMVVGVAEMYVLLVDEIVVLDFLRVIDYDVFRVVVL